MRDFGGGGEAGNRGGDRRRRVAALLLPALRAERRAVRGDEVRRRPDVVGIESRVRHPELLRHQDRIGALVELRAERVRRGLSVREAVARHRAVGLLLPLEQEERRVARRLEVAVGHQARPRLVQVAREDLAVGAEVRVRGVAGRHRLAPWRREARSNRARERLVLGRLDHVRAQVVRVVERLPLVAA